MSSSQCPEINAWNAGCSSVSSSTACDPFVGEQRFVAIANQALFVLTAFSYAPGTNSLTVHKNGSLVDPLNVQELTTTTFWLQGELINAGDIVVASALTGVTSTVSVLVTNLFSSEALLSDGQQIVPFPVSVPVANSALYINGPGVDNGRLVEATQYTLDVANNTISLIESYPAGTTLLLVYNDAGATNTSLLVLPSNTVWHQFSSEIGTSQHLLLTTGANIRTNYFDSVYTPGSGGNFKFTGITTVGKAGNVPNIDGFFYDADGKQFAIIGVANVLSYGAVGDGVKDSAIAIQSAINMAVSGGINIVYFPMGIYLLGISVGPASEAFGIHYKGDGIQDTIIKGNHNEGPVMFLNRSNSRVEMMTIDATASRTVGNNTSTGGLYKDNVGLLFEPLDIVGKSCAQCALDHVRIINQPSHGLVWIGPQQDNSMRHTLFQNNAGHGAMFDGGIINSRINVNQIGQMTMIDFWALGNGGNGIAIGNPADIGTTTPYRFNMINLELSGNGTDASYRYSAHEAWIHAENSSMLNSAVGGNNIQGGIAFQGRDLIIDNTRFVESQPAMTIYDSPVAGQITSRINIRNMRNVSTIPSLNPAIVINDLANVRNIRVDTATQGNVISWFTAGAQDCVVNLSESVSIVEKANSEIVNNSIILQDDDELKIALVASETVQFEAFLRYTGDATADIKFAFTAPSGATVRWQPAGSIYVSTSDSVVVKSGDLIEGLSLAHGTNAGTRVAHLFGQVVMSTTGGNLTLQWAQQSAVIANTQILFGSILKVYRSNYGN